MAESNSTRTLPCAPLRPNDITVMPIPGGFVLGRVIDGRARGPWWEYLGIVPDRETAIRRAQDIAATEKARAWLSEERFIPLDPVREQNESSSEKASRALHVSRMPNQPCPVCSEPQPCPVCSEPTLRTVVARNRRGADPRFYQCAKCGHLWTLTQTVEGPRRDEVSSQRKS